MAAAWSLVRRRDGALLRRNVLLQQRAAISGNLPSVPSASLRRCLRAVQPVPRTAQAPSSGTPMVRPGDVWRFVLAVSGKLTVLVYRMVLFSFNTRVVGRAKLLSAWRLRKTSKDNISEMIRVTHRA